MTDELCAHCLRPRGEHEYIEEACPHTQRFAPGDTGAVRVLASCIADIPNEDQKWVVEKTPEGWRCTTLEAWKVLNK